MNLKRTLEIVMRKIQNIETTWRTKFTQPYEFGSPALCYAHVCIYGIECNFHKIEHNFNNFQQFLIESGQSLHPVIGTFRG